MSVENGINEKNICEDIRAVIDVIYYNSKKKEIIINGWGFSINEEKIDYFIKDKVYELKHLKRADVYNAFNEKFKQAFFSGFEIIIKNVSSKDVFEFYIGTEDKANIYSINSDVVIKKSKKEKIDRIKGYINKQNLKRTINYLRANGVTKTIKKVKNHIYNRNVEISILNYKKWIEKNENYNKDKVLKEIEGFKYKPLLSICIPVYNVEENLLKECIESIKNQYYKNWEICLADDCSTKEHIRPTLEKYAKEDSRIKVVFREKNGHISKCTNSAIEIASGEFIVLMDNDDVIPKWCLYEVAKLLNEHPEADLIYSNEDKLDMKGNRVDPHFKPAYSPDTFLSCNYISHLGVYRTSIVREIGGFRVGYEGSQDYDLALRFVEKTGNIFHIPKILYHWRMVEGSTALGGDEKNYAYEAGFKALEDTIKRRGYNARVEKIKNIPYYDVIFEPKKDDFVSIIIPTKDGAEVLEKCLSSIYEKTAFKNYEVIVIDNNSEKEETFALFDEYKKYDNFTVLEQKIPFNFSKINNNAVKIAKGNLLLFLNNDTEVISPDWIDRMAGEATRESVGAVGARLFYPNDTVQHGGVILAGEKYSAVHIGLGQNGVGYFATLETVRNYSAVTAACLMVRKSVFEEVGGFEEALTVAYNDVDLCLKIQKAGYNNVYIGAVKLYHYESVSRGYEDSLEKLERFNKEKQYMFDNWKNVIENDPCFNPDSELKFLNALYEE